MLIWNRLLIMAWAILYVLGFFIVNSASAPPEIKVLSVDYSVEESQEKITLYLSSSPEYRTTVLEHPDRIVIDLQNSFLPETHLVKPVNGKIIKSLRISQNTQNRTRVVLDIRKKAGYNIVLSPASSTQQQRLTVQITPEPSTSNSKSTLQVTHQQPQTVIYDTDKPDDILIDSSSNTPLPWEKEGHSEKPSSFSVSGSLMTRFNTDTVHNGQKESNANEQTLGAINRFIVSTSYKDMFTLSAKSDYQYAGDQEIYETHDLDLYEAYLKYSGAPLSLKVGKQIRRWGKADQFSPVDTLNPEDIRQFITLDYEDRKIPVWMADATLKLNNFSIEAAYIPIFEPMQIDYFGTDWAFYSHLKEDIRDNPAVPEPLKPYFEQMAIHSTEPDNTDLNGEYAVRVSTTLNDWDLGATYHYTWEDQPFFKSFPVKNLNLSGGLTQNDLMSALDSALLTQEMVEINYLRNNIFGMEFETIISDLGVRGEAAWHESQPFLTSSLFSTEKPVFYSIIGADYTGPGNWYANFQFSYTHISGYETNILYFKQDTAAILGEINKDIFSSWVNLSLHYHITLNENQFYLSPRIEYTYIPNLDITFGLHIFEGSPYTFMGRFDDNDQLFLDMKYHF